MCCPINIHVKLPVEHSYQEILYKENLFDGISLGKIGRTRAIEMTGSNRFSTQYNVEAKQGQAGYGF